MQIGLVEVVPWPKIFGSRVGILTSVLVAIDFFLGVRKVATFNLENNKCICQGNFLVYHVTGSTYSRVNFWKYIYRKIYKEYLIDISQEHIYKTLNGIGKFVSELTILLNLEISKYHENLHKEKKWNFQSLNTIPFVGKLTLL